MPRQPQHEGNRPGERVRYAVVGLGHIAQVAILPAFRNAANCELVALVSGDAGKRDALARRYKVRHAVDYEGLEDLLDTGEVDAVFLAVPNHLHCEYTVRAARKGVHVLVEKPMAVTEEECLEMHRACEEAGVKLMVAYRLHFEAGNMDAARVAREELGELRYFSSVFSQSVKPGDVRLAPFDQGGGTLFDIGIYCINAARYLFRSEPVEVVALMEHTGDDRFSDSDTTTGAILRFPDHRIATFVTCFDAVFRSEYRVAGTRGDLRMEPAYPYATELAYEVTIEGRTRRETFPKRDQFGPELVYFSSCILEDRAPEPDWREGLEDVRIIHALLESARQGGRPVRHTPTGEQARPDEDQVIGRPPVEPPEPIKESGPTGGS